MALSPFHQLWPTRDCAHQQNSRRLFCRQSSTEPVASPCYQPSALEEMGIFQRLRALKYLLSFRLILLWPEVGSFVVYSTTGSTALGASLMPLLYGRISGACNGLMQEILYRKRKEDEYFSNRK